MKKAVILIVSIFFSIVLMAKSNNLSAVQKGTVLTLGACSASGYMHIDFPRKNTIIKRGAIANFNSLEGRKVIVTEIRSKDDTTEIVIKRKDGLNFFRFFPTATANLEKAIIKNELIAPTT